MVPATSARPSAPTSADMNDEPSPTKLALTGGWNDPPPYSPGVTAAPATPGAPSRTTTAGMSERTPRSVPRGVRL
jgi:hypothetical protein